MGFHRRPRKCEARNQTIGTTYYASTVSTDVTCRSEDQGQFRPRGVLLARTTSRKQQPDQIRSLYGVVARLNTKLEEITFLVCGLPDFICLGSFKCDWFVADRAVYFRL